MATRPTPIRTRRAAADLGEHIRTWRKLLGLTSEQLAERVGVNRGTITRLERGDAAIGIGVFLSVANALGQLDNVVKSVDPYETPLGRARSDEALPQRVRR
jgi:transcriptional regulator with XRE-family HTH domain